VLADLAAGAAQIPARMPALLVREVDYDDWARSDDGRRALRQSVWTEPPDDRIFKFAPGTSVVEVKAAGAGVPGPGSVFLVRDDARLTSTISSREWALFLARVDGRRSVAEILALAKLRKREVVGFLAAALDEGILVAVEAARRPVQPGRTAYHQG
jgi:hypothetical protein